jgi:hypothetical protein
MRDIIPKFILWTLAPKTDMPLKMMQVAILRPICNQYCLNRFTTPEVDTGTGNIVIPALCARSMFKGERFQYPPDSLV